MAGKCKTFYASHHRERYCKKQAIQGTNTNKPTGSTDKKDSGNTNNKKVDDKGKGNTMVTQAINKTGQTSDGYDDLYD